MVATNIECLTCEATIGISVRIHLIYYGMRGVSGKRNINTRMHLLPEKSIQFLPIVFQ